MDSVPEADSSFVDEFLSPALKIKSEDTRHFTNPNSKAEIAKFMKSHIFFNHWIRTDDVLRPSVLVKAWNRNVAIMCESGATGIDFVIPVMMEWSHAEPEASKLGGCTKPWNEDQQKAASRLISYILIQTKNRKGSSSGDKVEEMIDAVPLKRGLSKPPNFVDHEPQNPVKRPSLELIWTRSTLEAKHKEAIGKLMAVQKTVKDKKSPAYTKASTDIGVAKTRVAIATQQIPIVAYGLDGLTFKCLETRPRLTTKLNELLTANVDPVYQLQGIVKLELLESRVCISDADRRRNEPDVAQVE
jgi:hypothetical protein